jgi:hypothetical protein
MICFNGALPITYKHKEEANLDNETLQHASTRET